MTDPDPYILFLMFLAATGGELKVGLKEYLSADIEDKGIKITMEEDEVIFTLEDIE